jgi:hypothetical protein
MGYSCVDLSFSHTDSLLCLNFLVSLFVAAITVVYKLDDGKAENYSLKQKDDIRKIL